MNSNKILIIIISILTASFLSNAQEEPQSKPLELPNFIIEGREQLNIQSGIKQYPEKPTLLQKSDLDSINSIEKQQSLLLPQKPVPDKIISYNPASGFLRGGFGMFVTPVIEGGYGTNLDGYNIFVNGGLEYSNGHIDNSGYFRGFLKASSEYQAPEKFFIFGGSKTTTSLLLQNRSFELYSMQKPLSRSLTDFDLNIVSKGNYEGYDFRAGAGFKTMQLSQDDSKAFDNNFTGFLEGGQSSGSLRIGGKALIDLHSVRGDGVTFLEISGNLKYFYQNLIFYGKTGYQHGISSKDEARPAFLLNIGADYLLNHLFTIRAGFINSLGNSAFYDLAIFNPYISDSAVVDFELFQKINILASYHPSERLNFSGGVRYTISGRKPYFINSDTGTFSVSYDGARSLELMLDGYWRISESDNLTLESGYDLSYLNNDNRITYTPPFHLTANYRRNWYSSISSVINVNYIADRFTDKENNKELAGFILLNLRAEYIFQSNLLFYIDLKNITNSEIIIWNGYKERGIFAGLGAMWRL